MCYLAWAVFIFDILWSVSVACYWLSGISILVLFTGFLVGVVIYCFPVVLLQAV
jgi:hypothetical protein